MSLCGHRFFYIVSDTQLLKSVRPYEEMMTSSFGMTRTFVPDEATVFVYTGGPDINPEIYGHLLNPKAMRSANISTLRDGFEIGLFNSNRKGDVLHIGICRGAQLLHALNGGTLYQHVDNHTSNHSVITSTGVIYDDVTSTHHQAMKWPSARLEKKRGVQVLAVAGDSSRSSVRFDNQRKIITKDQNPEVHPDVEVVWWPKTQSFCFQPHPEVQEGQTRSLFRALLYYALTQPQKKG